MNSRRNCALLPGLIFLMLLSLPAVSGVQYSNDFENPSSIEPSEAWPEWVDISTGAAVEAVTGRIEWKESGNHWLRLDQELPEEYVVEFDFFFERGAKDRFSFWPIAGEETVDIWERHHYFLRDNTHFFSFSDTVPSEGERDLTLPLGSDPHRMRAEVKGDQVALLYKEQGKGGWILIDEREFPAHGEGPKFVQLGMQGASPLGLTYIDNFVLSYREENIFSYSNDFEDPSSSEPSEAWPELLDISTGAPVEAVNGRIEWKETGNHWLRLDKALPNDYIVEFDFFFERGTKDRFSFWPIAGEETVDIWERHHYFLRDNTHYFSFSDTVPSEGERDLTLPLGTPPHRIRAEVSGDHVLLLYKDQGEGGWILIDERDFPPHGDGPRYVQLGMHGASPMGVNYIDNLVVRGVSANRAVVEREIQADEFNAEEIIPVSLNVEVTGVIPSIEIIEGFPKGWHVSDISEGGVVSDGAIIWSLKNLSASTVLTYNAMPPKLIFEEDAGFSGSVDSGDGAERITGDTLISMNLPYLYREAVDYDFSGSPVDGKNYPTGNTKGELYAEGMDGIPSDVVYERPSVSPEIDATFEFPDDADFHHGSPGSGGLGEEYDFPDYRDEGEIRLEQGSSDTGTNVGGLSAGDWFRYTFDVGEEEQVLLVNISLNTWSQGNDVIVDLYVDNQFKGEYVAPETNGNEFNMFTVGPFAVSSGEHGLVLAIPDLADAAVPDGIGRIEVVSVAGLGRVSRTLTEDGFFDPTQPLPVSLEAEALYGSYSAVIEETIPSGAEVTDIGNGGEQIGNTLVWELDPTDTSTSVTYSVKPPEGSRYLLFEGYADVGLPLADSVKGDGSVMNELWLFGESPVAVKEDDFSSGSVGGDWLVEYGSDPALDVDYESGVFLNVTDGEMMLEVDQMGIDGKNDEWSNGRRAPMILLTDIPEGDWRFEADITLGEALLQEQFQTGIAVTYNDGSDTNISGDEYLFGFYQGEIRVELTDQGQLGNLEYHNISDVFEWFDYVLDGNASATFAVTKRDDMLIFSCQLPDRPWQLVGSPVSEDRAPTRVGFFTKIWGTDNFVITQFDNAKLLELEEFVGVVDWMMY